MNIMFVAYGTGGSEIFQALEGVVRRDILERGYSVEYISISEYAKNKFKASTYIKETEILEYIGSKKVDILINERSNGLEIQNGITEKCKELGIYNICILDFYGGYQERFKEKPNCIIIPSKKIYKEIEAQGMLGVDLYLCGNASFDRLQEQNKGRVYNLKEPRILYASQGKEKLHIISEIHKEIKREFEKYVIEIKPHPQEDMKLLEEEIGGLQNIKLIEYENTGDFIMECLKYDLVVGYNSTLQIQSYIMGIPVIFYELGEIEKSIQKYKAGENPVQYQPYGYFEKNATEKTIKCLVEIIETKKRERSKRQEK